MCASEYSVYMSIVSHFCYIFVTPHLAFPLQCVKIITIEAYATMGFYVMQKPSADRPADTILAWDKQMAELIKQYKASGYDLSKFPTCERDATHPSVLDFNKMLGGKYAAYTVSSTNGAIDATKLKGAERSAVVKVDAITSVTVDVGKYMKLADDIVKAGTK